MTIKLAWNKVTVFPHRTFTWQGIDGSAVLVHMPPEGDYNSRGAADGLLTGLRAVPREGAQHRAARLRLGRRRRRARRDPPRGHASASRTCAGCPGSSTRRRPTSSARLETARRSQLHTHTGELYLETHQGTYTTQAAIKKGNRVVERKLHDAEALAAIVGDDSRRALEPHWRDVLLGQFHDILPGLDDRAGRARGAREPRAHRRRARRLHRRVWSSGCPTGSATDAARSTSPACRATST